MTDVTTERAKSHFLEGGNGIALATGPLAAILCAVFYNSVSVKIAPLGIKVEDIYSYVFNLFAIEFAALLALFALFVCRPTPFLERMKTTNTFAAIIANTKITMAVVTVAIAATFILGILRLDPDTSMSIKSALFLAWAAFAFIATAFYARTVRLIFLSLH